MIIIIFNSSNGAKFVMQFLVKHRHAIVRDSIDGEFAAGEELTGAKSGTTASLVQERPMRDARDYATSYLGLSRLWGAETNIDAEEIGDYTDNA